MAWNYRVYIYYPNQVLSQPWINGTAPTKSSAEAQVNAFWSNFNTARSGGLLGQAGSFIEQPEDGADLARHYVDAKTVYAVDTYVVEV